ncbi:MAG: tetratricopeptide repeat protein [Oscillatoriales cyanobacterium RM2_1_1]|nr:tetratricopeptide repeat protein [Oscillatoriales cyanobacterium RM2_1_1]
MTRTTRKSPRWKFLFTLILSWLMAIAPSGIAQVSGSGNLLESPTEVNTLVQQGQKLYDAGDFQPALVFWQQASSRFQQRGDRFNQAMALGNLSLTYQQLGQWPQAREAIITSLNLLGDETQDKTPEQLRLLAQVLNIQGNLYLETGEPATALDTWKKTAEIYRRIDHSEGLTQSQINQAEALQNLGLNPRACQVLLLSLGVENQDCKQNGERRLSQASLDQILHGIPAHVQSQHSLALLNLADLLRKLGQPQQAQILLEKLRAQVQYLHHPEDVAQLYLNLGNLERELQHPNQALENYDQVIQLPVSSRLKTQAKVEKLNVLIDQIESQSPQINLLRQSLRNEMYQLPVSQTSVETQIYYAQNLLKLLKRERQDSSLRLSLKAEITTLLDQVTAQTQDHH